VLVHIIGDRHIVTYCALRRNFAAMTMLHRKTGRPAHWLLAIGILTSVAGCRKIGFRELDVTEKNRASVQTARDVMAELQRGLRLFYEEKHRYPATTEAHVYDSIRNFIPQIDPVHLYRNDFGKGYFLAVGGRANRIIYRYPPTVGTGDYTLYWIGQNGVDEEGEGDDIDAWQPVDTTHRFERQRSADLQDEREPDRLLLIRTGPDLFRDSVRFEIIRHDSILYRDSWPLMAYFRDRPELTDADRRRMVRTELDRFLSIGSFVHTDSLLQHDWSKWVDVKPKSPEMAEIVHSGELMFNYFAGDRGSKGIAWLASKRKFVTVWKS
jgi:hypothetical protein